MKMHSIASFMNRREVRLGAAFLCFMLSSTNLMAQQTTAATLAANLGTGRPGMDHLVPPYRGRNVRHRRLNAVNRWVYGSRGGVP